MSATNEAGFVLPRKTIWNRLGFRHGHAPRGEQDSELPGWAPGWLVTDTRIHLGWSDRLRVLISGKLHVESFTKTDVVVSRALTTTGIGVLPPGSA